MRAFIGSHADPGTQPDQRLTRIEAVKKEKREPRFTSRAVHRTFSSLSSRVTCVARILTEFSLWVLPCHHVIRKPLGEGK
jgi:hypothetical protein